MTDRLPRTRSEWLENIREAAEVLIREWDESNPFVGYSVESLRIVLADGYVGAKAGAK